MSPMREIIPTMAPPAPMPAFAAVESPVEEDVAVEDGALDEDVVVTKVEIGVDVLGLETEVELELELDEDEDEDEVGTKSEAWYRIETP
jgi:hypothetical protein